jgi:hypothetical protein
LTKFSFPLHCVCVVKELPIAEYSVVKESEKNLFPPNGRTAELGPAIRSSRICEAHLRQGYGGHPSRAFASEGWWRIPGSNR